ncbi:type II toxin-antitoxin system Phd/YefM family antitoxin [Sphingomonas crocodyli]|uniref:Antitoxin n=1 Tax=Sphingomonas crocodyli TaxID=1979270 RepID=A0A437LZK2_9SPHN|nr:type II toxin-antitoxin system Phd/YefM family antitoxin [Sphingomonas crocodyli]RVT90832.1 type II toxin-antitoxin system Phd/YefM family antitoxin [Sphingomonas crocodyli]
MGRHDRIKPISYLKANSAEVIRELADGAPPLIITQNGEAKAVLQDIGSWHATQETLALLKLLAMGREEIARGETVPVEGLADRIRDRFRE